MTIPENRKYFNSPSVYRGSTPKGEGVGKMTLGIVPEELDYDIFLLK